MSVFGKYGTGGTNPGKPQTPSDDNSGNFTMADATMGTEKGNPDSKPEVQGSEGSHK